MDEIDCKTCKGKYQDCPGKEFYTVEDIRWCPSQVLWMIEHFFELDSGGIYRYELEWPDTIAKELPTIHRFAQTSAYFTKSIEVIAELAVRLKRLGRSGELLLAQLQAGMEYDLTDEAKMAFYYITGVRRKKRPFHLWKGDRKRGKSVHLYA